MPLSSLSIAQKHSSQAKKALDYMNVTERGHSLGNSYLLALVCHYMYPHAYPEGNAGLSDSFPAFRNKAKPLFESLGARFLNARYDIDDKENVQYAVMSTRTAIIVAFRGSDAITSVDGYEDWIETDLNSQQKLVNQWGTVKDGYKENLFGVVEKDRNGRPVSLRKLPGVHTGFFTDYWDVRGYINRRIAVHGGSSKQLFVTGHSLGAALATLCAIDQGYGPGLRNRYKAQAVYTCGGPRVGNGLFKKLYDSKSSASGVRALNTHRYVNNNDGIPMYPFDDPAHDAVYVPISLYGLGEPRENVMYTHVGRTSNIKADGQIVRDDKEFRTNLADPRSYGSFSPHHSKDYCHEIFHAHIEGNSWAGNFPEAPQYPLDEDPLH